MVSKTKIRKKHNASMPAIKRWLVGALLLSFFLSLAGVVALDYVVREKFEGKKWSIPARVYARPLELYVSKPLRSQSFEYELSRLSYVQVERLTASGQWLKKGREYKVFSRGFDFIDGQEKARKFSLEIESSRVSKLESFSGDELALLRLEPLEIGGIYPNHPENRTLVSLLDVPPLLGETLIAVEDRGFVSHFGISPKSILRAALANIRAGGVVQGGSTITQQLIKNFYLDSRQNLGRKILESLMAVSLELHYSKAQILETYINEVYLGQSGAQGVHGFGLASQHYFGRTLIELNSVQIALLVGLVKGASYYNPWKNPARALERRNRVLQLMKDGQLLTVKEYDAAIGRPLGIVTRARKKLQPYPAFLELVRRQLLQDYEESDLKAEGLAIFTTLDPQAQHQAEESLSQTLNTLELEHSLTKGGLQSGLAMLALGSAEVLALVGDRKVQYSGFNRAIDIRRPIGSLVKPAVYLAALGKGYSLSSLISDAPVAVRGPDQSVWKPRNFSRQSHGDVPLYKALAFSYNQATARLGMNIGLDLVESTLQASGLERSFAVVPSLLLGSLELSPLEVASMYHTFAADGFYTKPRAIRSVQTPHGETLKRYALRSERRFPSSTIYQLNYALSLVMQNGTGQRAKLRNEAEQRVTAGKTGTTNDQRDSWFSGYDGDQLVSIWVGRDDNGKTPLTGSTGALRVWADLMSNIPGRGLTMAKPANLEYYWVDSATGNASGENCRGARLLPFEIGQQPQGKSRCEWRKNPVIHWWRKVWQN